MTDQRLGTEPIRRLFVTMTMPVVLQQLLMLLNNVVDRIWIAHIPEVGQLAFTASGVYEPILYIMIALAALTDMGISPRVGLLLGQGHHDRAERTLGSMLAFSLLLAMLTLLLVEVFCPELIRLFGGSPQTAAMAECYLRIATPGNALCIVSGMLTSFLLVQGYSTEAALVMASGIILNMVLDPIFIFLFGWGIAGAAWATTVAEMTSLIMAVVMLGRVGNLHPRLNLLRLEWRYLAPCLAMGATPMVVLLLCKLTYFYARKNWQSYTKRNLWAICVIDMLIATLYNMDIYLEHISKYTNYMLTKIWIRPTITYGLVACFVTERS